MPQNLNRATQGILTLGIQIRVRLIEHDQERIAIYGPRKANSLTLTGRQRQPAQAYPRPVSFRQAQYDFMHACNPCSLQYRFRRCLLIEAANVFRNGAVEQRHILRQIADMPSQIFVTPLIDGGVVEPDRAMAGRPDSNQGF